MGKVIIKAIAGSAHIGNDYKELKGLELGLLDGIECEDDFVEYMDEPLSSKLESGKMEFKFEDDKLYTITTYVSKEELTEEELEELGDYTQGQWSDGIGEGFEQYSCTTISGDEVFLSPWYDNQELTITQE